MRMDTGGNSSAVGIKKSFRNELVAVAVLLVVAALTLVFSSHVQKPFASAEVQFTDASAHGLAIVPASCPSSPHYVGDCSGGVGACPSGQRQDGNTCTQITCPSGWTLQANDCIPPASIGFVSFTALNPNGNFNASGNLQVFPILVRSGDSIRVYWNVANATGCTVSGTNGDSWTANLSGDAGQTSGPITAQTVYTMVCEGLVGASPPEVQQSQTINIVPVFNER